MQRSAYGRLNATLISHALMTTPTTSFPRRPAAPFPHPRKSNTPPLRHSHEGGNPHPSPVIPAETYSVIPAKAGIQTHHPSFPRKPTPSFPRRRESTIPAHAGIQRKHHPNQPDTSFPHRTTSTSFPQKRESTPITRHSRGSLLRHSRKGGNPNPSSVIPAKAGIHNSRACGNSTKTPSLSLIHI